MQDALGIVIVVVVVVAALIAVVTVVGSSRAYDEIGRGGLALRDGSDAGPAEPAGGGPLRDEEIRQMVRARNARRERRGEAPLDVEVELARLTAAPADPGLAAEIRQLVIARNARRQRRGEAPLDVEAEVARRLDELT